jgi:hypothetical protein
MHQAIHASSESSLMARINIVVQASVQPGSSGGPERSMLWPSQLGSGIINLNARLERLASKYVAQ